MFRPCTHSFAIALLVCTFACSDDDGGDGSSGNTGDAGASTSASAGSGADGTTGSGTGGVAATGGAGQGGCGEPGTGGTCASATVGSGGESSSTTGAGGDGGSDATGGTGSGGCNGGVGGATGAGGDCCCCDCTGGSGSGAGGGGAGPDGGDVLWESQFPFQAFLNDGTNSSVGRFDVASDGAGNVLVVGKFNISIDFGGGLLTSQDIESGDTFLLKLDPSGNHVWSSASVLGPPSAIAADASGNAYVVGTSLGGWYLAKVDPSGNLVWNHSHAGGDMLDVAVGPDGYVYVGGTSGGPAFTSAADVLVQKINPLTGDSLWAFTVAHADAQSVLSLAVTATGRVAIVGSYVGTPDLGGGPLPAPGGGYVAVLDAATGAHIWSKGFAGQLGLGGTPIDANAYEVGVDATGAVVVLALSPTGDFGGGPNPIPAGFTGADYLVRFSPSGQHEWTHGLFNTEGPGTIVRLSSLPVGSGGQIFLSALIEGDYDFGGGITSTGFFADAVVAAFHADGSFDWSTVLGQGGEEGGTLGQSSVALDPDGHPVFAGVVQEPPQIVAAELFP
jgi:hypothetical protein